MRGNATGTIAGWGHSVFGKLDQDLESLIVGVAQEALNHAEISGDDVDAVFVGHFNAGLVPDSFVSSLPMQADRGLRFKPSTRVENACASGSAAIYAALDAIAAKRARVCLVVGAEKMTAVSRSQITESLARASYIPQEGACGMTFPGLFASMATDYFARYGDHSESLARIAAKNHWNGVRNPYAQFQRDLGFEFCNTVSEKNPFIAAPLRKTDCSLVSDGAAALIIAAADSGLADRARFRARVQVNDFLPISRRNPIAFEGPRRAWTEAMGEAGVNLSDLAFAEVHDCFTIAELLSYEAMGLTAAGEGWKAIDEGTTAHNGTLPVNPSGGLKAKGHPIGATGVSMHVLAAMQVNGMAGRFQVEGASIGAVFNMGGSAVANYVSIIESGSKS